MTLTGICVVSWGLFRECWVIFIIGWGCYRSQSSLIRSKFVLCYLLLIARNRPFCCSRGVGKAAPLLRGEADISVVWHSASVGSREAGTFDNGFACPSYLVSFSCNQISASLLHRVIGTVFFHSVSPMPTSPLSVSQVGGSEKAEDARTYGWRGQMVLFRML